MLKELVDLINSNVSGANATLSEPDPENGCGDSSIIIDKSAVLATCQWLKSNDKYPFNALQVISGVDYTEYIEVCYILANFDVNGHRELILKTRITDRVNGNVDSVDSVWPAANYQERECYDMLGITFNNHPDHRRILCPDDWEGFPLRKDYVAAKYYGGMEVYPDDKMNFDDREFIVRQKKILEEAKAKATEN